MQPVSEPTTATLATWIAARLSETEALALACPIDYGEFTIAGPSADQLGAFLVANDPAATLRRVEADRKILALHGWAIEHPENGHDLVEWQRSMDTLRALASQFAGADGWREDW